ncbi:hypothetical protein PI124_g21449 [Phytophthora idaei]|nr:hypothetical protein PI125_g23132 [Phytophthora idaei]KAG3128859.1 hypothetical protein PI126_g21203 [Phytophthora idaei]KAG3233479.1 hypothetical protein PI124_g21449 [Phytophthora idaei]
MLRYGHSLIVTPFSPQTSSFPSSSGAFNISNDSSSAPLFTLSKGNERAMSAEYNALGKDYRARLKSAPDDAQMARLVLEDIREGDGRALSRFALTQIFPL